MDGPAPESSPLEGLLTMSPGGVIAAGVIMPLFACVAVLLRLYARRWQRLFINADDWTMLAGALLVGVLGLILIVGAGIGALGLHSPPIGQDSNPKGDTVTRTDADAKAEKIVQAYSIAEKITFAVIKISIVLLYRRIFGGSIWNIIVAVSTVASSLMAIAFGIVSGLQCQVRNWGIWYVPWTLRHHCVSAELSTLGFSIADVITDLIMILLPLPFIWRLKLSTQRKLTVFVVFVMGASSIIVGIIRMSVLLSFTYYGNKGYRDLLGVMSTVLTMSIVEAGIAVIAACTPTFRNLVLNFFGLANSVASSRPSDYSTYGSAGKRNLSIPKAFKRSAPVSSDYNHLTDERELPAWPATSPDEGRTVSTQPRSNDSPHTYSPVPPRSPPRAELP